MKKIKATLTALALSVGFAFTASGQMFQDLFNEDFASLTNGTTITTSNTDLTYVRVGTGGGSITAQNPSSFSGASAFITGPSSTSLNGIGATGFDAQRIYEMAFDFRLGNTSGNMVFGVGDGSSFTSNNTFSTADGLFWMQVNGGQLQRRQGTSWNNVGDALAEATNYSIRIVANGSAESFTYDSNKALSAGKMNVYLNGTNIASEVAVTNSLSATAFRIYSVSGSNFEVDNITISAVPEPATYAAIVGLLALGLVLVRRRMRM